MPKTEMIFINNSVSGVERVYAKPFFTLNVPGLKKVTLQVPTVLLPGICRYLKQHHPAIEVLTPLEKAAPASNEEQQQEKALTASASDPGDEKAPAPEAPSLPEQKAPAATRPTAPESKPKTAPKQRGGKGRRK